MTAAAGAGAAATFLSSSLIRPRPISLLVACRAVQLFDWLRALPVDSPLAPLCTPATYATMIGLYGRWRKPKPAVRLFAELKERGEDGPEVHSALVEAFCRCGWRARRVGATTRSASCKRLQQKERSGALRSGVCLTRLRSASPCFSTQERAGRRGLGRLCKHACAGAGAHPRRCARCARPARRARRLGGGRRAAGGPGGSCRGGGRRRGG